MATETDEKGIPKSDQLYLELEGEILTGQRPPGSVMPSLRQLREQTGFSTNTIIGAMDRLEASGLIERNQGSAVTVRFPRVRVRRTAIENYVAGVLLLGEAPGAAEQSAGRSKDSYEITAEIDTIPADSALATAFRVAEGTLLLRRIYNWERLKTFDPLQLTTSYLRADCMSLNPEVADPNNEPWPGGTTAQLHSVGIEVEISTDHVTARPPYSFEASALGISPGVSVLVIRKITEDSNGRIVEVTDSVHPGDTTELVYRVPVADLARHRNQNGVTS